jgi:hypothetical protein
MLIDFGVDESTIKWSGFDGNIIKRFIDIDDDDQRVYCVRGGRGNIDANLFIAASI